jgi:hypothetical protein
VAAWLSAAVAVLTLAGPAAAASAAPRSGPAAGATAPATSRPPGPERDPRPVAVPASSAPISRLPVTGSSSAGSRPLGPVPPSTVPFTTKTQSAHVNPIFARLSIAGFATAAVMVAFRVVRTRPGRRRPVG